MKGFIIDCAFVKQVIEYLPKDEWEIIETPIISIEIGVWE